MDKANEVRSTQTQVLKLETWNFSTYYGMKRLKSEVVFLWLQFNTEDFVVVGTGLDNE